MQGKYQINLTRKPYPDWPSAPDSFESRWRRFMAVCRLLHRDNLDYQVRLEQRDGALWAVITASGDARRRRQSPPKTAIPNPPDLRMCQARLAEAERNLHSEHAAVRRRFSRWREDPDSRYRVWTEEAWLEELDLRRRHKKLGKAVGVIIARRQAKWGTVLLDKSSIEPYHKDYAELDAAVGGRVPRLSSLKKHEREQPYLAVIVRRYGGGIFIRLPREPAEGRDKPDPIRRYQEAAADVEYWKEMARLHVEGSAPIFLSLRPGPDTEAV